ncbi:MAG TPA: peptidoglycan-binding domain-containing protein [Candidatus Paceibacterota bacterium]
MRYQHLILVTVIVFGIILSNVAVAAAQTFDRNLYFGLIGDSDVERLQQFLKDRGLYTGPVNGNFFSLTRAAVQEFQKQHKIEPAVGYVGPKTRAILNQTTPVRQLTLQEQIAALLQQIEILQAELAQSQQAEIVTTLPATTTMPAVAPIPSLPNPFISTLKIKVEYPSITLSKYIGVTLTEFVLQAQEKIAITRLRFKNNGTLGDPSFLNLELVDSQSGVVLISTNTVKDGYADFQLTADPTKANKGVLVSGRTYFIRADLLTPNTTEKPKIRLDLMTAADIRAFDYDDLTRIADITSSLTFPIEGPTITTF